MKIIKRKINLDKYTNYSSLNESDWGKRKWEINPNFNYLNINLFITQDIDDLGIATDIDFIGYDVNFINDNYNPNTRLPGKTLEDYFQPTLDIYSQTEDRLSNVKSYKHNQKYKSGLDIVSNDSINYEGDDYTSVSKVLSNVNGGPIIYIEDGDKDELSDPNINLETFKPNLGILFKTYENIDRVVNSDILGEYNINLTEIYYKGQGFNETNSQLSASIKEEYLIGITSSPRTDNDVFIDRGRTTVNQSHLQLGEVNNMFDLINYGNGYYKTFK